MARAHKRQRPRSRAAEETGHPHPSKAVLPGVRLIAPAAQGELDGLCGLLCIINAIRLVLAPRRPLTHLESRALFGAGIRYIANRASLPRAVQLSVGKQLWPHLAEHLRSRAEAMFGVPLRFERPFARQYEPSPREMLKAVETMILDGKAVMVFMRGAYKHYSCISGYTPTTLRLFDSFGYHRVRRSSCGAANGPRTLHRFHVASLIAASALPL